MLSLAWKNPARAVALNGRDISIMALMISFPVVGLEQFLRTAPAGFLTQPYVQAQHWLADSLMALPLFVAGVWAGDRIASRAGLGTTGRADVLKRALVITLLAALALVPLWFWVDKSDNPVTAQPLVFPHAQDSGDVYWVAPPVILALVCVCLVPVAVWAADGIRRGMTGRGAAGHRGIRLPRGAAAAARAAVLVLLLAAVPVLAWLLHQAAGRAYASQVYYTSALTAAPRHHHGHAAVAGAALPLAGQHMAAAPFAFVYQAAHALQDGLAGQAAGLPVAVLALLRAARGLDGRNQRQPADTKGGAE